jgi:hypothetical protein
VQRQDHPLRQRGYTGRAARSALALAADGLAADGLAADGPGAGPILLASDFDGTLAELVPDPWGATILPTARRDLRRLAATWVKVALFRRGVADLAAARVGASAACHTPERAVTGGPGLSAPDHEARPSAEPPWPSVCRGVPQPCRRTGWSWSRIRQSPHFRTVGRRFSSSASTCRADWMASCVLRAAGVR